MDKDLRNPYATRSSDEHLATDQSRKSRFTARIVCGVGCTFWTISLVLPALVHGRTIFGIECFLWSVFLAIPGVSVEGANFARNWLCRAAVAMHIIALWIVIQTIHGSFQGLLAKAIQVCVIGIGVCAFAIYGVPGATHYSLGFYCWLTSLVLIGASTFGRPKTKGTRD